MISATNKTQVRARGEIFISDQAIAALVRGALNEVAGIHGLSPHEGVRGVFSKAGREHTDIHIASDEGGALRIKLHLVVQYGLKLDDVAKQAIAMVKRRVQALAGVEVAHIDVEIKGLYHPRKPNPTA